MAEMAQHAENAAVFKDQIASAFKPVFEMMEPYLAYETTIERGVPVIHDELDCSKTPSDIQCKHKVMAASPMVGAGHHVRAKTNVPVIGILTQPINDQHPYLLKQFEDIKNQTI